MKQVETYHRFYRRKCYFENDPGQDAEEWYCCEKTSPTGPAKKLTNWYLDDTDYENHITCADERTEWVHV